MTVWSMCCWVEGCQLTRLLLHFICSLFPIIHFKLVFRQEILHQPQKTLINPHSAPQLPSEMMPYLPFELVYWNVFVSTYSIMFSFLYDPYIHTGENEAWGRSARSAIYLKPLKQFSGGIRVLLKGPKRMLLFSRVWDLDWQ